MPKFITTASKVPSGNGSASASPSRNSIPGFCERASSTIAEEKSRPVTRAPRCAAADAA
jgi:hypothetical protein